MKRIVEILKGHNKGMFFIQYHDFFGWHDITREEIFLDGVSTSILKEKMFFNSIKEAINYIEELEGEQYRTVWKK